LKPRVNPPVDPAWSRAALRVLGQAELVSFRIPEKQVVAVFRYLGSSPGRQQRTQTRELMPHDPSHGTAVG